MFSMTAFWVLIVFYVVAKICFFSGVYIVTKAVERRAVREKKKRLESHRIYEIETLIQNKANIQKNASKDKELFGARLKRYVS
jgi:hypothetical protein